MERESDVLFAACSLVTYGCEQKRPFLDWKSGLMACSDKSVLEGTDQDARHYSAKTIQKAAAAVEDPEVKEQVLKAASELLAVTT